MLAVNAWDETPTAVRKFADKAGLKHTLLMDGRATFYETYKSKGIPQVLLIDRSGRAIEAHSGFEKGDEVALERMITAAL